MKKIARISTVAAGVVALSLTLSGCFFIPLADGRSPFDDPFGPSEKSVQKVLPAISEAVKTVDTKPYLVEVELGSDNCEGPCNLSPEIHFTMRDDDYRSGDVPAKMLAELLVAAIPATDGQPLRISAYMNMGTLEEVQEVIPNLEQGIGGLHYSDYFDELFIPAEDLSSVKASAEKYLEDNSA